MKYRITFEHRRTGLMCHVPIDASRYLCLNTPDISRNTGRMARVAAMDAVATAQHLLSADRPADLHVCNMITYG